MVDRARALHPALRRRRVVGVEASAPLTARLPAVVRGLEGEPLLEQRAAALRIGAVCAHGVEALQRQLAGDLGMLGDQRLVRGVDHCQLELEALGIPEAQPVAVALGGVALAAEPLGPEVERVRGRHAPHDPVHHPVAGPAAGGLGELEEGEVGARAPLLVGVEQVVHVGAVLVDGLLHHPQPHQPRVEVHVRRRVRGDAGDVVDALELHRSHRSDRSPRWS